MVYSQSYKLLQMKITEWLRTLKSPFLQDLSYYPLEVIKNQSNQHHHNSQTGYKLYLQNTLNDHSHVPKMPVFSN